MKTLFTIGYEGSSAADLFGSLRRSGVKLLIDVRDVPISRKRGFSKTALSEGLSGAGIAYLHLKGARRSEARPYRSKRRSFCRFPTHLCCAHEDDYGATGADGGCGRRVKISCLLALF